MASITVDQPGARVSQPARGHDSSGLSQERGENLSALRNVRNARGGTRNNYGLRKRKSAHTRSQAANVPRKGWRGAGMSRKMILSRPFSESDVRDKGIFSSPNIRTYISRLYQEPDIEGAEGDLPLTPRVKLYSPTDSLRSREVEPPVCRDLPVQNLDRNLSSPVRPVSSTLLHMQLSEILKDDSTPSGPERKTHDQDAPVSGAPQIVPPDEIFSHLRTRLQRLVPASILPQQSGAGWDREALRTKAIDQMMRRLTCLSRTTQIESTREDESKVEQSGTLELRRGDPRTLSESSVNDYKHEEKGRTFTSDTNLVDELCILTWCPPLNTAETSEIEQGKNVGGLWDDCKSYTYTTIGTSKEVGRNYESSLWGEKNTLDVPDPFLNNIRRSPDQGEKFNVASGYLRGGSDLLDNVTPNPGLLQLEDSGFVLPTINQGLLMWHEDTPTNLRGSLSVSNNEDSLVGVLEQKDPDSFEKASCINFRDRELTWSADPSSPENSRDLTQEDFHDHSLNLLCYDSGNQSVNSTSQHDKRLDSYQHAENWDNFSKRSSSRNHRYEVDLCSDHFTVEQPSPQYDQRYSHSSAEYFDSDENCSFAETSSDYNEWHMMNFTDFL